MDTDKKSTRSKKSPCQAEANKYSTKSSSPKSDVSGSTDQEPRTAAVMFVNNTKDGQLAKNLRKVVERLKNILGCKVKIVERAGTSLKQMFPLTRIGGNKECGREECITCTQDSRGEEIPPCNKRSVLYENICTKCNPGVKENKTGRPTQPSHPPSIYVGETSRSLFERGKEHWKSFKNKQEVSHILKHHQVHHGGIGDPSFHLRPVGFFKSALTRQVAEAVLIQEWGEDIVLNSKAEFNRCKIGRLTLGEEDKLRAEVPDTAESTSREEESGTKEWESRRAEERRAQELLEVGVSRGLIQSPASKRLVQGVSQEEDSTSPSSVKKMKAWKHPILGEEWGSASPPPPSPPSSLTAPEKLQQPPPPPPPSSPTTTPRTSENRRVSSYEQRQPKSSSGWRQGRRGSKKSQKTEESRALTRQDDLESPSLSSPLEESLHQPPPDRMVVETHPPVYIDSSVSTTEVVVPRETLTRADTPTVEQKINLTTEDNQLDKTKKNDITVNRVSLMEMMKTKKTTSLKKTTTKQMTPKNKNKKNTTPTPSNNSIRNYLTVKKQEDNPSAYNQEDNVKTEDHPSKEDNLQETHGEDDLGCGDNKDNPRQPSPIMKMTFGSLPPPTTKPIKDKIMTFQDMCDGDTCVFGSGMCATYHTKLVRRVVTRRVSYVDKCGAIKWKIGEGTILDCPGSKHSQRCVGNNTSGADILLPENPGTNKKTRLSLTGEVDQSEVQQHKVMSRITNTIGQHKVLEDS